MDRIMNQRIGHGSKMPVACHRSTKRNKEKHKSVTVQNRPIYSY